MGGIRQQQTVCIYDEKSIGYKGNLWFHIIPLIFQKKNLLTHISKIVFSWFLLSLLEPKYIPSAHVLQCYHAFGACAERLSQEFSWDVRDWYMKAMKWWWALGPDNLVSLSKSWLHRAHCKIYAQLCNF